MTEEKVFGLNVVSELLVADHPLSMAGLMSFMAEDYMTTGLATLDETLATGKPSFEIVNNQNFYDYLSENDLQRNNFNDAMQCIDKTVSPLLATEYDWSDVNSVVDLGGGVGSSALFILKENQHIKNVTVVEVEDVVQKASACKKNFEKDVDRLQFKIGNMFDNECLPQADIYMLKNIIHDWSDQECDKLLTNVATHLDGDTSKRVLVIEKIVPLNKTRPNKAGHDIVKMMFFQEQAKHRSLTCFREMFSRNGLTVTGIIALADTDYHVIEGRLNASPTQARMSILYPFILPQEQERGMST